MEVPTPPPFLFIPNSPVHFTQHIVHLGYSLLTCVSLIRVFLMSLDDSAQKGLLLNNKHQIAKNENAYIHSARITKPT